MAKTHAGRRESKGIQVLRHVRIWAERVLGVVGGGGWSGANSLDQQISGPGKKDLFQDLCPAVSSISAKLFPASLRFNSAPEAALR